MSAPIPRPGPPRPGPYQGEQKRDAASTVAAVEAAVRNLGGLEDRPVGEHVARYDTLHGELSDALAAIDGV